MIFKPLTSADEWSWMRERTHIIACEDSQGIVALDGSGAIAAICVADSFTVDSCCVHLAIDNPLAIKHGFLQELARHFYLACGRERLFGLVPDNNAKALKLDEHIGFTEIARIPNAVCSGVGYVVMCLEKADCRWLPKQEEAA